MQNIYIESTTIGKVGVEVCDGFITRLYFENALENIDPARISKKPEELHLLAFKQLNEYLTKSRKIFDLPIKLDIPPFHAKVLAEMQKIGYGEVKTYGELAAAAGNAKAARAVGSACNKNPIAVIVPCHRVVGSNRSLTGFAGGLDVKSQLLELEGIEL